MNGGRTKERTRATDQGRAEEPRAQILRVQPSMNGGLARDTMPVQTAKTQLDATFKSDPLPAKRARLTRTGTQRPGVKEPEQADKTTRQLPKSKPPKRRDISLPEPKVEKQEQVSPATRPWKRQIDSDGDDDQHKLKLTRQNLALFNKMERKKASAPESTNVASTTNTTSATTSGFAIKAYKNGILDPSTSKPPTNLGDIRKRHAISRDTASPTESEYKCYDNKVGVAYNEATMVVEVNGKLLKEYDDDGYQRAFTQTFTSFPQDFGFNNGLSAPRPDFTQGLEMREYDPVPVDEHVSGAVLYKDNPRSLTLPHFAGEWKGLGKGMEKARLQSAYDGAALVYTRNQALSYLGKPDPPGHAEVTTFTTDGTNLNFFAHYAAPTGDGTVKYHQYKYASENVQDTYKGHRDGRRGIRNAQDHAKGQSYALRNQIKEHWKKSRGGLHPTAEGAPDGTLEETNGGENEDEDEAGYEVVEQPCQPTPAASSQSLKASSSVSSSLPPTNDSVPSSGGQKRKASSPLASPRRSSRQKIKEKNY